MYPIGNIRMCNYCVLYTRILFLKFPVHVVAATSWESGALCTHHTGTVSFQNSIHSQIVLRKGELYLHVWRTRARKDEIVSPKHNTHTECILECKSFLLGASIITREW